MRTKIIATLGPASQSYDVIRALACEGVSAFRINMNYGGPDTWNAMIESVRKVEDECGRPLAIIGDLPGPQVRVGKCRETQLVDGSQVVLFFGEGSDVEGEIPVPVREFFEAAEAGDLVIVGDGEAVLRVVKRDENRLLAIASGQGTLREGKRLVIRGKEVRLPSLTTRDVELLKYLVARGADYVALSYVRTREDVDSARGVIRRFGGKMGVIAKIETRSAVKGFNEIAEASDAVLIARGDLGLFFDLEELPALQSRLARQAVLIGKPVILATQLLESMVEHPMPRRGEVIDVYSAVVDDLVDAVLLTSETAVGKYPLEVVRWLKRILARAERDVKLWRVQRLRRKMKIASVKGKYALGLVSLAEGLGAKVLVFTKGGTLPPAISRLRPLSEVYVGSSRSMLRRLCIFYGLRVVEVGGPGEELSYEDGIESLQQRLRRDGVLRVGDLVVKAFTKFPEEEHVVRIRRVME
ncbi:MAG: pyruvate kinase [Desulfurococcaceae archaeon]